MEAAVSAAVNRDIAGVTPATTALDVLPVRRFLLRLFLRTSLLEVGGGFVQYPAANVR
jgi:hypothetical protein